MYFILAGLNFIQPYILSVVLEIPRSEQGTISGSLAFMQEIIAIILVSFFGVLSDPDAYVTKKYGVFNLLGDGVATPAVFIIDSNKTLTWSYIGGDISDRADVKDILSNTPVKYQ